jgi:hypothetical protein
MRVHTYASGARGAVTHPDVADQTRLRELVVIEADERVYQVGGEAELDIELTVLEIFGAEPGHVVVHHCREIAVTVSYAGADKVLTVRPSAPVKEVRAEAIDAFRIDAGSSADLALRLPGSPDELAVNSPVGAYVPKGSCALTLDLVHLVRPQG